jgi:uncharacterized membrane protein
MIYPPLVLFLMVVFFLITLVLFPLLWFGIVGNAFVNLGLSPDVIFWLLILTLVGSLVNLPLTTIESHELVAGQVISYFGMKVRLPPARLKRHTVLAVNLGGALVPAALSLYLFVKIANNISISWRLLAVLGIVTAIMYQLARPVKGLGIAVSGLVPPLVAALELGSCARQNFGPLALTSPAPWGPSSAPTCLIWEKLPRWARRWPPSATLALLMPFF